MTVLSFFLPLSRLFRQTADCVPVPEVVAAQPTDVAAMAALVQEQARRGNLLPRSRQAIAATLDDWFVVREGGKFGKVAGCVQLRRYHGQLAEIRSLAVDDAAQGKGHGRRLVEAAVAEARRQEIPVIFALTRAVAFFRRCGFQPSQRQFFPEKVWHDCRGCPLIENCDETAMVISTGENGIGRGL